MQTRTDAHRNHDFLAAWRNILTRKPSDLSSLAAVLSYRRGPTFDRVCQCVVLLKKQTMMSFSFSEIISLEYANDKLLIASGFCMFLLRFLFSLCCFGSHLRLSIDQVKERISTPQTPQRVGALDLRILPADKSFSPNATHTPTQLVVLCFLLIIVLTII